MRKVKESMIRLYNQDMYNYLMSANLEPIDEADVDFYENENTHKKV